METKKFDFLPSKEKIFSFDVVNANLAVIFGSSCYLEYTFSNFGTISPEPILNESTNSISFKNSEIIDLSINLYLPDNLKGIDIKLNKGNIFLTNGNGSINVSCYKGGIKIINSDGDFKLDAFDGEIDVSNIKGKITINGDKSHIKIRNWESLGGDITTNYGSIFVETMDLKGDINIRSNGGKVSFGIAGINDYYIIARGKDVINYLENIQGKSMGSPAEIICGTKEYKINIFSRTDRVLIARSKDLEVVSPDIVKIFDDFEKDIAKSIDFNKISKSIKDFGKKAEEKTKSIFERIGSLFSKEKEDKNISERQQILNLLKEGKITAEEAERLLKALK
ncbi:MAG TPA: hypothetical protein PLE45_01840 [Spirochaetota bacterium]|nr:hypothetical protein [Spirochaetota bacterium]HOL56028.1 hypothetical protein [Spirochaetota bacterium]HPP03470.1 hypothetical protein [Spirochaetota bacterium]